MCVGVWCVCVCGMLITCMCYFLFRARVVSPDKVVPQTLRRSQRLQLKGTGSPLFSPKTESIAEPLSESVSSLVAESSSTVRRSSRLRISAGSEIAIPAKEKTEPLIATSERNKNNHVLNTSDCVKVSLKLPAKKSALNQISASTSELSDSSEEEVKETVPRVLKQRQKALHGASSRDKSARKVSEDPGDPQQETKSRGKKRRAVGSNTESAAAAAAAKGKVRAVVDPHLSQDKERSERSLRNSTAKKGKGRTKVAGVNR